MNNFLKILSAFVFCVVMASCTKSKSDDVTPLRDYATQYAADKDSIEKYVTTHYMTVDPVTYDVTFTKIGTGGQQSIKDQTQYPLLDTIVFQNGINYHVPFIRFREGDPLNGRRPTQVDSVNVVYKGVTLKDHTISENNPNEIDFDAAQTPVWFKLQEVVPGWAHIIPMFKTGTYTAGTGGNPTTYNNFGAGVMFLPSALGYYNNSAGTISAYSPIIFTFKLIELRYRDHDFDGILSKDERFLPPYTLQNKTTRWKENPLGNDFNSNGSIDVTPTLYDTDGDGIPDTPELNDTDQDGVSNMYDIDDDGDHVLTRVELLRYTDAVTGKKYYYKYDGATVDDPATPFDDTQGVPSRTGTDVTNYIYDYYTSTRKRKHVDNAW